jgi:hypothetical protein
MPDSVQVEAPDLNSASALRRQLLDFDSSLLQLAGGRWKVSTKVFSRGFDAEMEVDRILGLVRRWLATQELESTIVQLRGKSYRMLRESGARPFRPPWNPESRQTDIALDWVHQGRPLSCPSR